MASLGIMSKVKLKRYFQSSSYNSLLKLDEQRFEYVLLVAVKFTDYFFILLAAKPRVLSFSSMPFYIFMEATFPLAVITSQWLSGLTVSCSCA